MFFCQSGLPMLVLQLLYCKKNIFCFVKFFRGAPEAKNTINSSLRSKNFPISFFLCMRHFIIIVEAYEKFELIFVKNGREISVFIKKALFLGHFLTFGAPRGGLGVLKLEISLSFDKKYFARYHFRFVIFSLF